MKSKSIVVFHLLVTIVVVASAEAQSIYNGVGHIPLSSQIDWTVAGPLADTPTEADFLYVVTEMPGATWDVKITNALDQARGDGGVSLIYFPADNGANGEYVLSFPIILDENDQDLVFQGAGSGATTLKCYVGSNNNCFDIRGRAEGPPLDIISNIPKGQKSFVAPGLSSSFGNGDWVHLEEPSFPTNDNWASIGQISRLETVSGDNGTLVDETSKAYSTSYGLQLQEIVPVRNIGIENLNIFRGDTGKATSPDQGSNIYFKYAVNCWVKGVESQFTSRHHIMADRSSHLVVSGSYLHDSRDFGSGGFGYGVILQNSTTNSLIENNLFRYLRHSMLVQAGANANVFEYNYSRETHWTGSIPWPLPSIIGKAHDIALHGNYPYGNLFEQNNVELIFADSSHGDNGPYNAFLRNIVYDDEDDIWYIVSLKDAPHSSVLGNLAWWPSDCPLQVQGSTTLDTDLFGKAIYTTPPNNTYETGIPVDHCLEWLSSIFNWNNLFLADISYYYSEKPSFVGVSYSWPSCGPAFPIESFPTQSIPARGRWFGSGSKTYLADPTTIPPPVITGFTQTPNPFYPGATGRVYVQTSGHVDTYQWEVLEPKPANATVTIHNNKNYVTVSYSGGDDPAQRESGGGVARPLAPLLGLRATVSSTHGSDTQSFIVAYDSHGGGGCPWVFIENHDGLLVDNNILHLSELEENRDLDIVDLYKLQVEPESAGGEYRLRIRELEKDHGYLDSVRLYVVDHPTDTRLGVTEDGRMALWRTESLIRPLAGQLSGRTVDTGLRGDLLELAFDAQELDELLGRIQEGVYGEDGEAALLMVVGPGNRRRTSFKNLQAAEGPNLVEPGPIYKDLAGVVADGGDEPAPFARREASSTVIVPLGSQLTEKVTIAWNRDHSLQEVALVPVQFLGMETMELALREATHSRSGEVQEHLWSADEVYVHLEPADDLGLVFAAGKKVEAGLSRSFVLEIVGHYDVRRSAR
jgi:hypothetical protein